MKLASRISNIYEPSFISVSAVGGILNFSHLLAVGGIRVPFDRAVVCLLSPVYYFLSTHKISQA